MPPVAGYVILTASIVVMALAMMLVTMVFCDVMTLVMRVGAAEKMPIVAMMVVTMMTATVVSPDRWARWRG